VGRTRTLYTLDDGGLGTDRLGRVKVVGSWVWFQHDHSDQYGSGGSTIVADTATGRNYSLFGFRQFFNDRVPSYDAIAEHAFLSPHGEVVAAVRGGQHAQAPVTPDDVIEIHATTAAPIACGTPAAAPTSTRHRSGCAA
jgi:hypothetical protein